MKIKLVSDLHHEFYEDKSLYENKSGADVLVVAGDLAVGANRVEVALKLFGKNYEHVIYVPGNHEYYGSAIAAFDHELRIRTRDTNIHFLNPGIIQLREGLGSSPVTFIGATLWSDFQADAIAKMQCSRMINDFNRIRGFNTDKCVDLSLMHRKYIETAMEISRDCNTYPIVVVTHFLPTIDCIAPRFRGPDLLNKYFANDLSEMIEEYQPAAWLFGHTHDPISYQHINTKVIANPYGYYENKEYKECLIEV